MITSVKFKLLGRYYKYFPKDEWESILKSKTTDNVKLFVEFTMCIDNYVYTNTVELLNRKDFTYIMSEVFDNKITFKETDNA